LAPRSGNQMAKKRAWLGWVQATKHPACSISVVPAPPPTSAPSLASVRTRPMVKAVDLARRRQGTTETRGATSKE
jgi:hypothetical protein